MNTKRYSGRRLIPAPNCYYPIWIVISGRSCTRKRWIRKRNSGLKNTRYTQPALFVTEYALAQLWMSWGIQPTLFCGHSIGEFVAAHLAGVFSLPDALTLIAARGKMVSEQPRGSMLSVRMAAERVSALMTPELSMAAINSHTLCVVAGPDEHIADFARLLDEQGIANQPLSTSHAFHSAMMDPIVAEFAEVVAGIPLNRPRKPVVSTVSGTWMTDAQATDPHYWAKHLRDTVRFSDALDTIFSLGNPLLLEVGPGHVMATLARQQAGKKPIPVLAGIADLPDWKAACRSVLNTLGLLYQNGIDPDWAGFYAGQQRKKVQVPTYAFTKKRCWLDPVNPDQRGSSAPLPDREVNFHPVAAAHSLISAPGLNSSGALVPDQNPPIAMRKHTLIHTVSQLLEEASGIEMDGVAPDTSFLEIGLDSLLLTQVALTLKKEFGVPITFRQLTNDYTSPEQLADYLDQTTPGRASAACAASRTCCVCGTRCATRHRWLSIRPWT